jgi:hypothetical protein
MFPIRLIGDVGQDFLAAKFYLRVDLSFLIHFPRDRRGSPN